MAEQINQEDESTKQLIVVNRILWTGINTTNKKLQKTVEGLAKTTKALDKLGTMQVVLQRAMFHLSSAFSFTIVKIVSQMAAMSNTLSTAILEYGRFLEKHTEITTQTNKDMEALFKSYFKEPGKKEPTELSEMSKHITNFITKLQGALAKSNLPEGLKKTFNKLADTTKKFIVPLDKAMKGIKGAAGKGLKSLGKAGAAFGKRQVLKALSTMTGVLNQFVDLAVSPILAGVVEPLKAIGTIFKIILIPLKPLLFGLELLANVLEAAFAPIMLEVWEGLQPVFDEMVLAIPDLTAALMEAMGGSEGLKDFILKLVDALMGLLNAMLTGDLLGRLMTLSMGIMDLALKITKPETLEALTVLGEAVLKIADLVMGVFGGILDWLASLDVGQIKALFLAFAIIFTWLNVFSMLGGGPWGAIGATIAAVAVGAVLGSLLYFQEGGTVPETGLIFAHEGETVHAASKDDQIIELLEQNNYLQSRILIMKEEKYR